MPPIERVAHLRDDLRITCLTCRHQARWTPQDARRRFGAEATTVSAKRRLKCSRCGERRTWLIAFSE